MACAALQYSLSKTSLQSWRRSRWLPFMMNEFLKCSYPYCQRTLSTSTKSKPLHSYIDASDPDTEAILARDMIIHQDFLSVEEEESLLAEVEPYMKRLRYEYDHWDNAIHGYRETERGRWNESNSKILQRVKDLAFPPGTPQLAYTHILDISKDGYIKPHVDAVRFCGTTIAGLCLLSSAVMRLVNEKNPENHGNILLRQRSLYIMKDVARFDYTHEVLPVSESLFRGQVVPRDRRISIICRNEPSADKTGNS